MTHSRDRQKTQKWLFFFLLPIGAQTARPNGLKLRMEVGLDPGTDTGWVCSGTSPSGGYVSKKKTDKNVVFGQKRAEFGHDPQNKTKCRVIPI